MLKKNLLLLLIFSSISICGQEERNIQNDYLEYFKLPRETIYLHTNKTSFLINEDIWFSVYVYDRKNELSSKRTKNIHLGLYDNNGNQIDKRLYQVNNGIAIGDFAINQNLVSGNYFLKVSTNWMKNFKEDDSYLQKIEIINPRKEAVGLTKINPKEYDFQFLPEGGHIVSEVKNSIGVKAINDLGKGTSAEGKIINSKNIEVANFKSNFLGIGKFTFTPTKNETYKAIITLDNGKEIEKELPEIKQEGISLIVNNTSPDKVIINLNSNILTKDSLTNTFYELIIHKDGKIKSVPLVFNTSTKQVVIAKKNLYKGMNTITIFANKKQILERMFFNNFSIKNHKITIEKIASKDDSISYQVTSKELNNEEIISASISILPGETKSYNPDNNFITAIHLKPYLNGTVENPQYYFKNFDRKKQYELDLLILTQGWSRYSWKNIFNKPQKPTFDFENGISINGFVNKKGKKINTIFMHPTKRNKSTFIKIDEEGKFNVKNFFPESNEEIRFSYLDKRGGLKKPTMSMSYKKLMRDDNINPKNYQNYASYYQNKNEISSQFIIDDSYEELDEIKLKTDYKRKLWKENQDPLLINGKVTKITEEEVNKYPNITDLLNDKGFDVIVWQGPSVRFKNGTKILLGDVIIKSRRQNRDGALADSPVVFIDEVRLSDFNVLLNMNTDKVEKVVVDKTGVGLGLGAGFGGAIKITTRKTNFNRKSDPYNDTSFINVSEYGFEPEREFYTPKYASYQIASYKKYGIIHWVPKVKITNTSLKEIKFENTKQDEIIFFIEGMSSNGDVFSQKVILNQKKNN